MVMPSVVNATLLGIVGLPSNALKTCKKMWPGKVCDKPCFNLAYFFHSVWALPWVSDMALLLFMLWSQNLTYLNAPVLYKRWAAHAPVSPFYRWKTLERGLLSSSPSEGESGALQGRAVERMVPWRHSETVLSAELSCENGRTLWWNWLTCQHAPPLSWTKKGKWLGKIQTSWCET